MRGRGVGIRPGLVVRCGAALTLFALTACGRLGYQLVDDEELTTPADAIADAMRVGSGGATGTGSPNIDASEAQGGAGGASLDAPVGATDASSDMNGSDMSNSADGPSSADAPAIDAPDAAPDATDAAADARDATGDARDAMTAAMTVDDSVQGVGFNQFDYAGSGWLHCTACIIGATYYDMSDSWSGVAGDVVTFTFTGTQLKFYGVLDTLHGIGGASIDGGPETTVDFYGNMRLGNQLLWTSPLLPAGVHTFALRVTGQKNRKSSDFFVTVDRVDVQ